MLQLRAGTAAVGTRGEVVFLGDSRALWRAHALAVRHGYLPTSQAHEYVYCLIADEDILDGLCTPVEARMLQQARTWQLPCLSPGEADDYLTTAGKDTPAPQLPVAHEQAPATRAPVL